jgi:hypothetical protein
MGTQVIPLTNLGGKAAGQLIRSNDWNSLVAAVTGLQAAVDSLSTSVDQRFATVNQSLAGLTGQLTAIDGRVAHLENVFKDYYRVNMATSQTVFAIGELAVITIQVTDLDGHAIVFAAANRPWITFLASWGRLQADTGFDTLGGFGDRGVSIRTDTSGACRVLLYPDHVEGFPLATVNDVHKTLTATLPSNSKSFAELIRTSDTPVTMKATGAFSLLSTEYERADTANLRQYVDTYYQKTPGNIIGRVVPRPAIWRDYRASVACYATVGSDPRAGDFNRGTGSIAVDFRDWIEPWYTLEYSANTASLLTAYRDRLTPKFTANLDESVGLVKTEVAAITAGGGLLKQRRDYDVIQQALGQVNIAQPPVFLNAMTQAVRSAIKIEQTVGAASGVAANQGVAFEVFTQAATRGDVSVAAVNDAVSAVRQQVAQVQQSYNDVNKQVSTLQSSLSSNGARLDAALADGGIIHNLQADVSAVKGQVGTLQVLNLNPTEIKTKLDLVASLDNRVGLLEVKK